MNSIFKKSIIATLLFGGTAALLGCDDLGNDNVYYDDSYENEGISPEEAKNIENKYIKQVSMENLKDQINKDNVELADMLKKMQATDPSIDSLYYSVDENGVKTLHVVQNDLYRSGDQPSQFEKPDDLSASDYRKLASGEAIMPNVATNEAQTAYNEAKPASGGSFSDYSFPLVGGLAAGYFLNQIMSSGLQKTAYNSSYPATNVTKNITEEDKRKRRNAGFYAYSTSHFNNTQKSVSNGIKTGKIKSPTSNLTMRSQGQFSSKSTSARSGSYSRGGSIGGRGG